MQRTFHDERELTEFAADFGRQLHAGDVVALSGPLGAGKTTFVRALVRARLGSDAATSPTFTFSQRYGSEGDVPIDHLDLYRVDDPRELTELGLDEVFDGDSIVLVEWWDRAPGLLPRRRYEIAIDGKGEGARRVRVDQRG